MLTELRRSRLIVGEVSHTFSTQQATIFLGLFNASKYLISLRSQLASQSPSLKIVAVDNNSEDNTWELLQPWLEHFPGQIILVKNPINLGATGSLHLNQDLIDTPWFMTMHQDDFYKTNHVQTLSAAIRNATPETICISTEMSSLNYLGAPQPTPPRASWFLPNWDPATIFTSNLRLHNVPFPASAFRSDIFFGHAVPWETTAFPDTEWVLRVASLGSFEFVEVETMGYRENPSSESHSINSEEQALGAALALLRVFGSASFQKLSDSIPTEDRNAFARSVSEGIQTRVGDGATGRLVSTFANQQLASAWGYSVPYPNDKLAEAYERADAAFPVSLLGRLNDFFQTGDGSHAAKSPKVVATSLTPLCVKRQWLKRLVLRTYGALPTRMRRTLAKAVGAAIRRLNLRTVWNFRWK